MKQFYRGSRCSFFLIITIQGIVVGSKLTLTFVSISFGEALVCLGKEGAQSGPSSSCLSPCALSGFTIALMTLEPGVIVATVTGAGNAFRSSRFAFPGVSRGEISQTATFNFAIIVTQVARGLLWASAGSWCSSS